MTSKEAYFYGFCKTAADAGIDPEALAKVAQAPVAAAGRLAGRGFFALEGLLSGGLSGLGTAVGRGWNTLSRGLGEFLPWFGRKANRFGELVAGGSETALRDYRDLQRYLSESAKLAKSTGADPEYYLRLKDTVRNAFLNGTGEKFTLEGLGRDIFATPEAAEELGKVYGARTLAALGAGGAGYAGYSAYKNRKKSLLERIFG